MQHQSRWTPTHRNPLLVHGLEGQDETRRWVHHKLHATVIALAQHPQHLSVFARKKHSDQKEQ